MQPSAPSNFASANQRDTSAYYEFYSQIDRDQVYTKDRPDEFGAELAQFIARYDLSDKRVLEVGSGRGHFQDCAKDYVGLDVSESLRRYYRRPESFHVIEDGKPYPLADASVDAAFTYAVLEHVPSPEVTLREMLRVLKPGGAILFHAAWQVRPWAARGLSVRPYQDLSWPDRFEKMTLPLRNSIPWRMAFVIPARVVRTLSFLRSSAPSEWPLPYRKLEPNYEQFWQSDSDACNHIDMHSVMLWFFSRGCRIVGHPTAWSLLRARTGSFIVESPTR